MFELVSRFWCRHFHKSLMRPVHGTYKCATCLRMWPVPWEHRAHPGPVSRQADVYTDAITSVDVIGVAPSH